MKPGRFKAAFNDVFTANVLRRLDIGEVKAAQVVAPIAPTEAASDAARDAKHIVTTRGELEAFEAIKMRLAFLSNGDRALYRHIQGIEYKDYQGKMVVFFGKERKGRLLDIIEAKDGATIEYVLADGGDGVTDLTSADERLISLFRRRIEELAVA